MSDGTPALNTRIRSVPDRTGCRAHAGAERVGDLGAVCQRGDLGLSELEPRAGVNLDQDRRDGLRRFKR